MHLSISLHSKTIAVGLLLIHAVMLSWLSAQHSPTFNELGHLPAGICHWRYGVFELYRVNPPLPRLVAALPILFCEPKTNWSNYGIAPFSRDEYPMGIRFAKANGPNTFRLFCIARLACIPFSLVGGLVVFRWAFELWGDSSGLLALALWCFNPTILGHGALVMPDVPAAAMAVTVCYLFRKWVNNPSWTLSLLVGATLALAELCKTTLLVLFATWPALWITTKLFDKGLRTPQSLMRNGAMIVVMIVVVIYVMNLGYGFAGSFQRLGEFRFQSRLLTGSASPLTKTSVNRFSGPSWLAAVPVPFPKDYVLGIDRQCADFELGDRSYLRGLWQPRGWWYYHLYALAVKMPLGTLIVFGMAIFVTFFCRGYGASLPEELCLMFPATAIIAVVSSQTGFSNHMRYTIPALPFLFVWMSRVARSFELKHVKTLAVTGLAAAWTVISSLSIYPHSISYFNEFVGGPKNGHWHLLDSNVAWGQDLLYLHQWLDKHPEAKPVRLATFGWVDPRLAGIEFTLPPTGPNRPVDGYDADEHHEVGPLPGWHIIDVNFLHGTHWPAPNGEGGWREIAPNGFNYEYFQRFQPVDRVAYSYLVYHITRQDANRVRRELGLPLFIDDSPREQSNGAHL